MYRAYRDQVAFLFVYIHEAHPDDGWQLPDNKTDEVIFNAPRTLDERKSIAGKCCSKLKLSMPCAVDSIDNVVDELYAAWPERMFIVGKDGKIAYAGKQGPLGFKPEEVEGWLMANVGPKK